MRRMERLASLTVFAAAVQFTSVMGGELPQKLALHFDFDSANQRSVPNLSGEVANGKVWDARFVDVEGAGKALFMRQNNIQSNFIEIPDHPDLNQKAFTVAAWVCPRRIGISGAIVCKHDWLDGGARGFTVRSQALNGMNFTVGAGGWISVNTKTELRPNTWMHVVATFDEKSLRIYANGKLEDTNEVPKEYIPSPYPLRVGHGAFKLDRHRKFDGKIDDVMIWPRCLSDEEAESLYLATKEGRPPAPTEDDVRRLIEKLGSNKFTERLDAQSGLIDLGPAVSEELEKEFEKGTDKEIRMRLQKVMDGLASEK